MAKSYKEITNDISRNLQNLGKEHPEMMEAFQALQGAAIQDGALNKKTKELIALAIGISSRCDGCIGFHTKKLIEFGCTRKEFVEMLSTTVFMGGGPVLMYAANALDAYDEFSK